MNYKVLPTKEFINSFKKLDPSFKERIKKKIEEVSIDPTRYKQLHYDLRAVVE
jgi:mRNA-degrading endonuclease RelE of RelBE toxin-antitoxin system